MAPHPEHLVARDYGCGYGRYWNGNYCSTSSWYFWGRWVLAAVALILFALVLMLVFCARHRRRRGLSPMYGTGWMATDNKWGSNQNPNAYPMNNYNYPPPPPAGDYGVYPAPPAVPPPAYGQQQPPQNPQYTGSTFNPNDGYYGQPPQVSGVQPPPGALQRDAYAPPDGPPPAKN